MFLKVSPVFNTAKFFIPKSIPSPSVNSSIFSGSSEISKVTET